MTNANACVAVIAAAGDGKRCGFRKQFAPLADKTVLFYAVQPFIASAYIEQVYVVVAAAQMTEAARVLGDNSRVTLLPCGGATRARSVYNGLADIADECWVLVHDGARPCLSAAALERLLAYINESDGNSAGAVLALPVAEALKTVQGNRLQAPLPRADVWATQTPQLFRAALLKQALQNCSAAADEAEAVLAAGGHVDVILGERQNIKITDAEDLTLAARWLTAAEK